MPNPSTSMPVIPPHYSPIIGNEDIIADFIPDPKQETLHIQLWRSGSRTFYLIIGHKPPNLPCVILDSSSNAIPVSEDAVFHWARKHADVNTYIRLYGTVHGYEGPSAIPTPYSEDIRSDIDEILLFARTTLSLCTWSFLFFDFIKDLYHSWHNRYFPARPAISSANFFPCLQDIVYTNGSVGQIGWAHVEHYFPVKPYFTMSQPEPMIDEYNLEKWKNLRYGICSELVKQYDSSISKSWADLLLDEECWAPVRSGLVRVCKCNYPILPNQPFFREDE